MKNLLRFMKTRILCYLRSKKQKNKQSQSLVEKLFYHQWWTKNHQTQSSQIYTFRKHVKAFKLHNLEINRSKTLPPGIQLLPGFPETFSAWPKTNQRWRISTEWKIWTLATDISDISRKIRPHPLLKKGSNKTTYRNPRSKSLSRNKCLRQTKFHEKYLKNSCAISKLVCPAKSAWIFKRKEKI